MHLHHFVKGVILISFYHYGLWFFFNHTYSVDPAQLVTAVGCNCSIIAVTAVGCNSSIIAVTAVGCNCSILTVTALGCNCSIIAIAAVGCDCSIIAVTALNCTTSSCNGLPMAASNDTPTTYFIAVSLPIPPPPPHSLTTSNVSLKAFKWSFNRDMFSISEIMILLMY